MGASRLRASLVRVPNPPISMERTRPTARPDESTEFTAPPELRPSAQSDQRPAPGESGSLDQAEAQLVWRLAARMQAEAAMRLEQRSSQLARGAAEPALDLSPPRFDRHEVEAIAQAAGIDPAYVALAWREIEAERLRPESISESGHDRASRFLGNHDERLSVTRTVNASPEAVLESMRRVLPADPYRLTLAEIVGDADRLADATLIFDIPALNLMVSSTGGYTAFSYQMSIADLKRIVLTLHNLGDGRTEVTETVDAKVGKLRNFKYGAWITGTIAAAGGILGGIVGAAVGDGGAAALLGATVGSAAPGALTFFGYRAAYVSGLKKGEQALGEMLQAIDVDARSGGAFSRPTASRRRDSLAPPDA